MATREYSGAAKATSLSGAVSAAATTINVVDATGWPTGAVGPFVVTLDAGVTTEEKVLCSGRTGNSLAVSIRGFDGTTASDHANAATALHTLSATDLREANAHVNDSTGDPHPQYVTPVEGAVLYAGVSHTHPAVVTAKTIRTTLHFEYLGNVGVGDVSGGFRIPSHVVAAPPSQTVTLVKAGHVIAFGTATVSLLRNGTAIPGWTGITLSTTPAVFDGPDVALADGDRLELDVTAVGGGASNQSLSFDAQLDVAV